jgi:hypothetical protein
MNYTLLIFEDQDHFAHRQASDQQQAYWAGWQEYMKAIKESGILVGGAGLQAPDTATTVQVQEGKPQVQDGPVANTKEQLGGIFIIDVPDLDTALEWAARCPVGLGRKVEVRPNMVPRG